jgi:hypothetical protein
MSVTPITDHIARAQARLLEQYKNKPRLIGLLQAITQQIQDLEDTLQDLANKRYIDTAEGVQQDRNGVIVGVARVPGEDDADYLLAIKSKIIQNLNQATPEEVIAAAKFFIGTDIIWYLEVYPAAVDIFSNVVISSDSRDAVREQLKAFLPAGVLLDAFGQYDQTNPFVFDSGSGFGDVNDPTAGGLLADLY